MQAVHMGVPSMHTVPTQPALRQTLANAINRSSTAANPAVPVGDPSVGQVYMSSAAIAPAPPAAGGMFQPNGIFGGFFGGQPAPGPPAGGPLMPGHPGAPMQAPLPGPPPGAAPPHVPPEAAAAAEQEKDREIERLRRALRKEEEKTNFFRNQVMALQHQVTTMDKPVTSVNAPPLAEEVSRLRSELAEERVAKQQMQAAMQQGGGQPQVASLQARVQELEREIAIYRGQAVNGSFGAQLNAGLPPPPGAGFPGFPHPPPTRSASSGYGMPMQVPGAMHGDPLDPNVNPGGPRRAVVIGCDYANKIGTLRAGVSDAQQWARFLAKKCSIPEQDIRLLTDDPAHFQTDPSGSTLASHGNILRSLHWLTGRSSPGDQLHFIFCGHGLQIVTEEYAGRKLCENALAPTDVCDGGDQPRAVTDTDVHKALLGLPSGVQVTLIYDSCHAGSPLDRSGLNYLTDHVSRGRVDYDKLKGHPVLPRFLELSRWKMRPTPSEAVRESPLACQAIHWAACANPQFCVELPIDDRPRGVFSYIFVQALLKVGISAASEHIMQEMMSLTAQLKGRWRLQQDVQMRVSASTTPGQPFLR
eukprot:TRINITY_DN17503_c0_g1_i1.p1 TRINITY_DN17503_c0_g1~~TRINITY_DN17503_c0_g1_i1.p1  ORF type:complete len:586 (-),score=110.32 TRINITY_DN17503_c0_g1_i1:154-1911(-)